MNIAKFRSVPALDCWISENCVDHEVTIRKVAGGFIANVSGGREFFDDDEFSSKVRPWADLVRLLEATVPWSVKIFAGAAMPSNFADELAETVDNNIEVLTRV